MPGLGYLDAIGCGANAEEARMQAREALLSVAPQARIDAPPTAPVIRPASLTDGAPALWRGANKADGTCKITGEYADAATLAKRQFLEQGSCRLPEIFCGETAGEYKWPITFDFEEAQAEEDVIFPFVSETKRLALVHIDGNGVGQFYADLAPGVDKRTVSAKLTAATRKAAARAMDKVLAESIDKVVPARPILLGGDDISIILRADIAFNFARDFAMAFADETRQGFNSVENIENHKGLTAKVGIVFLGPKQPFSQAYDLCESLADQARASEARLSFWRLTGTMIPQSVDELVRETSNGQGSLWRPSWSWGDFEKLETLARLFARDEIGCGSLRQIPELALAKNVANVSPLDVYRRELKVLGERAPQIKVEFISAMEELGVEDPSNGFATQNGYIPLLDAHILAHLFREVA